MVSIKKRISEFKRKRREEKAIFKAEFKKERVKVKSKQKKQRISSIKKAARERARTEKGLLGSAIGLSKEVQRRARKAEKGAEAFEKDLFGKPRKRKKRRDDFNDLL